MPSAQAHIDLLDASLARSGETVRVLRLTGAAQTVSKDLTCAAFVRGYQPSELIAGSGLTQQDVRVILSPTDLATFPGVVPVRNDRIVRQGKPLAVQAATGIYNGTTLIRVEVQARGGP